MFDNDDHTLLVRLDENVKMILKKLDEICETQGVHAGRITDLEIAQGKTDVKIGVGATLAGIVSAIIGIFVQKP